MRLWRALVRWWNSDGDVVYSAEGFSRLARLRRKGVN